MRSFLFGAIAALGLALPSVAADRAIIVLDGSGSMWAQIDGKARITIARETLASVLQDLPKDLELGLMTYGHRKKGDCGDIELLVPPAAGTEAAIIAAADTINPKGMTPISDAVRIAAEDLKFTEEKATVILITDGLETCEVDPCALASELEAQGVDFTTHVLGFGLSDEEGQKVACLAENTGGKYLSASDGASLVDALTATVAQVTQAEPEPAPEPEKVEEPVAAYTLQPTASLAEGGPDLADDMADLVWELYRVAADGTKGEWVSTDYYSTYKGEVAPGDYIMTAKMDYAIAEQKVSIVAGQVAKPHFVLNAGVLKLHPMGSEGGDVDANAAVVLDSNGKSLTTVYGDVNLVVPAGKMDVTASIGDASALRSYDIKPGATIDEDVIVAVGIAKMAASYVPDLPVEADISMEILEAKKALDGTRKSITYGYGGIQEFKLAPGDYVVTYKLGGTTGEVPFTVKAAELIDVPVVLNAGLLAVTTPSDEYIEVFGAKKTIEGNRKSFDYGYGPDYQTTLPAGDYVIVSEKGGASSETPVTITAGERFELTVQPAGKKK